ncbi:MAG: DUF6456 domain-containing protein [Nitratireductor sp.]
MLDKEGQRQLKRLLKLLNKYNSLNYEHSNCSKFYSLQSTSNAFTFTQALVSHALRAGLLDLSTKQISITNTGRAHLKRLLNPDMPFTAQHSDLINATTKIGTKNKAVVKNKSESPLSRLFYRKDKNGESWIGEDEFNAGERFRRDFEKSQLQPKISANWSSTIASKGTSSATDISDFAYDAKIRFNKSLDTLGPELCGVALDVCCFLKGLETIEREKGWPPRSAKLILKTALSILVRHYGIANCNVTNRNRFWGSESYRPSL